MSGLNTCLRFRVYVGQRYSRGGFEPILSNY